MLLKFAAFLYLDFWKKLWMVLYDVPSQLNIVLQLVNEYCFHFNNLWRWRSYMCSKSRLKYQISIIVKSENTELFREYGKLLFLQHRKDHEFSVQQQSLSLNMFSINDKKRFWISLKDTLKWQFEHVLSTRKLIFECKCYLNYRYRYYAFKIQ